jgi:hypothetical protein
MTIGEAEGMGGRVEGEIPVQGWRYGALVPGHC